MAQTVSIWQRHIKGGVLTVRGFENGMYGGFIDWDDGEKEACIDNTLGYVRQWVKDVLGPSVKVGRLKTALATTVHRGRTRKG